MGWKRFVRQRRANLEMVTLLLAGRLPIHRLRVWVLRWWGTRVDHTATLYHGFQVRDAGRLRIGARSHIGDGAILDARGGPDISHDVNLSTQVQIWTAQHAWNDPKFSYESAPVVIEEHVWIGPHVTVLPGVRIGKESVVAAGAVVTSDVPPRVWSVGSRPACWERAPRRTTGWHRLGEKHGGGGDRSRRVRMTEHWSDEKAVAVANATATAFSCRHRPRRQARGGGSFTFCLRMPPPPGGSRRLPGSA